MHYRNVIGTPVFSIPYLGYVSDYVQHSPGRYVAIYAAVFLLVFAFGPDLIPERKGEEEEKP